MIDEFFILRRDGLNLFHIILDESSLTTKIPAELFAGFSSAIVAFANELGSGQLSKIEIEEQIFVYNMKNDLITVAKISFNDYVVIAEHIVALLEREFVKTYEEELKAFDGSIRKDIFFPFANKVREIVRKCIQVAEKNPQLLVNIPPNIDIDAILELSKYSEELVNNFPHATINLTRNFQKKLPEEVMHYTMFKLGKEVGNELRREKLKNKVNDKIVMKLLNKISICSLEDGVFTLKICPFCRGRKVSEFDCDFIAGFIEGIYNDPKIAVREINCHAVGHKNCDFRVYKL